MKRREFLALAAAMGASVAWRSPAARPRRGVPVERRDLFPQGVASGDPQSDSVLLWTRRPPTVKSTATRLIAEVAEDPRFHHVVAKTTVALAADADWTCRVLAAGLDADREYWFRFTDEHGFASRVGRTLTAPSLEETRPVSFAFVSCQNVNDGASNAYRRMIWEDERRPATERLGFVMHLGDFIYEIVWYPEDRPQGMYSRRIRDIVRYANGEKIDDFHVPTTVDDYRAVYRAYLADPDLQDARARFPFVCMWDNHEFSWKGWQSQQSFDRVHPAQTRKAAANQAWFEYQPARVVKPGDPSRDRYRPPPVHDAPIEQFDDHGLGLEADNLAVIRSLQLNRAMRWGRHVELILTDNRSFRSEPVTQRAEAAPFQPKAFPFFLSQHVIEVLDAGRAFAGGHPPETILFNGTALPNPRRDASPQSMLGAAQKAWFLERLRTSKAPWKLWGNSVAMLDWRTDFQNLPDNVGPRWPVVGYAQMGDDWSAYITERNEILDVVRREGIAGFATLCGDRHAFLAGVLSPTLPPERFEPVGVEFVTGSISAPGLFEYAEFGIAKDHPLRAVYLHDPPDGGAVLPAINFSLLHGVRASLALQRTGSVSQALAEHNPEVAPHLSLVDLGGHGYAVVRAEADALQVEFVCIVRPVERSARDDGGALAYRVRHRVQRWNAGEVPRLEQSILEGTPPLAV